VIRAWLRRRRRQTSRVEGLLLLVAELERDIAARDELIARLQSTLAPHVLQDLARRGLLQFYADGRRRAERLEGPTVVQRPQGRHSVDRTEWRAR